MKIVCKKCGAKKNITEFDKHLRAGPLETWNARRCKECTHNDYLKRYASPARRKALLAASRNWKKNNPERHAALAAEYRARHKERTMAQNRLNYAIKKGLIERQPCEICGTITRVHAHHASYDREDWYNVSWLCYVCHKLAAH